MPIIIGLVVIGLLPTAKASAARCYRLLCAVSQTEGSLSELSQQTACPTAFSNSNAIIRSECPPPFGDLRRSFLASANNVELNQPGIATTRSDTRKITREHIAPAVVAAFEFKLPPAKS